MDINTDLIQEYFNIDLTWDDKNAKIKVKLKEDKKERDGTPYRKSSKKNKIPYSGVQLEYYEYYIKDNMLAYDIWIERKKLCSKNKLIEWYMDVYELSDNEMNKLNSYINKCSDKLSKSLKKHYNSPEGEITKEKLKKRSEKWAPIIGKMNAEKWKDEDWVANEMKRRRDTGFYEEVTEKNKKRMSDPEYYDMFMKAVNEPERIAKISTAAKKMWKRLKRLKNDEYYRIINSGPNKNFELNGYHMNEPEFIVGSLLNSLKLNWVYEEDFNFNDVVYIPDFYVKDKNIIIECYGDYWHANPKLYESTDTIFGKLEVSDIWKKDEVRKTTFETNGYQFINLWETDIKNNLLKIKEQLCKII
jgi:G:T-mismatch repair DNA endonuclease (very short patch repair protein)